MLAKSKGIDKGNSSNGTIISLSLNSTVKLVIKVPKAQKPKLEAASKMIILGKFNKNCSSKKVAKIGNNKSCRRRHKKKLCNSLASIKKNRGKGASRILSNTFAVLSIVWLRWNNKLLPKKKAIQKIPTDNFSFCDRLNAK